MKPIDADQHADKPMITRHDMAIVLVCLLVGPPVGGVIVYIVSSFVDIMGLGSTGFLGPGVLLVSILLSYAAGWQAALISGVANALVVRIVPQPKRRYVIAVPIGAIPSILAFYQLGGEFGPETTSPVPFIGTALLAGGAASLVAVVLAERFRASTPGAF